MNVMKNKIRIVSTSWDDGHPCDLRLAEALSKRSLAATFYVPLANQEGRIVLEGADLRELLHAGFEVGAHTVSHCVLCGLSNRNLFDEVMDSKRFLEDELGREVRMFCYPCGRYNQKVIDCVAKAGFLGARTTHMFSRHLGFNPYRMPTSLQVFPHPPFNYLKNLSRQRDLGGVFHYFKDYVRCKNWVELGKTLFLEVMEHGGIWHLYGHSWEIDELGLWDKLDELFDFVSNRPDVIYVPNSAVLDLTRGIFPAAVGVA
jgi:peptidoglycan-N-acetylglucosamine deacetylase